MNKYTEFATEKACELLAIDSPTGFTAGAIRYVKEEFEALGFSATVTVKGGVDDVEADDVALYGRPRFTTDFSEQLFSFSVFAFGRQSKKERERELFSFCKNQFSFSNPKATFSFSILGLIKRRLSLSCKHTSL